MAKKQQQQSNPPRPAAQAKPVSKETNTGRKWSSAFTLSVTLGLIAFFLYANTLDKSFVLDDFTVIKSNRIVTQGISAIPEILGTPYRRGWFETHNDLYRPLSLVMFAAEYDLGNKSPWLHHFMNVLLFAGAVVFLFRFIDKLFDGKKTAVAFIATLLFAVHPIHTEVVANIKSRDELLCFFFAFLSLNIFIDYLKTGKITQLLLGGLCFFLAFLSKETVISFIAVIPFIFFFYRNEDKRKSIEITATTIICTILFLAIRYAVLSKYQANTSSEVVFMDNILAKPPSAMAALATEIMILGKYLKLLVVPYPLVCDYSYHSIAFVTFSNIWVIVALVAYVVIGVYGVYRLVKHPKDPYAFAIIFYMATIALFSNIPFIIGAAMAERFVFFASVGFCLAVALLVEQFLMKGADNIAVLTSGKVLAVLVPVCGIFAVMTHNRNNDWADNQTLFRADVANAPEDARLNYYLGTELVTEIAPHEGNPAVKNQIMQEGCNFLRKAIAVYPQYDDANASLGDAFFKLQLFDSAEVYNKAALQLNPKFLVAMNNLAGVYFMRNQFDTSIMYCRRAINQSPKFVNAYANIGLAYMRMKQYDSSLHYLYKAIEIDPLFPSSYENMMFTYKALNKEDSVRKYQQLLADVRNRNN